MIGFICILIVHRGIQLDIAEGLGYLAIPKSGRSGFFAAAGKFADYCNVLDFQIELQKLQGCGCLIGAIEASAVGGKNHTQRMVDASGGGAAGISCRNGGVAAIANLDEMTAKLQLLFSLVFALSFVIAGLFV